jgi:hypothetical protein
MRHARHSFDADAIHGDCRVPVSGCVEGHFLCFLCYEQVMVVEDAPRCPSCRTFVHAVWFMRNRMLDTIVDKAVVSCQLFDSSVPSKRTRYHAVDDASMIVKATAGLTDVVSFSSKPSKVSNMSITDLRRELSIEDDEEYISATELQRMVFAWRNHGEVAQCRWVGCMSALKAHLDQRCRTTTTPCPFPVCGMNPLMKDAAAHSLVCGTRLIVCKHCKGSYKAAVLLEHFTKCPHKTVVCPNEGCNARVSRGTMNVHAIGCAYEVVQCPCQPCDQVRLRRQDVSDHLVREHADEHMAARVLIATMQLRLNTFESAQGLLRAPTTTNVFNWCVPTGFQPCKTESEIFNFQDSGYSSSAIIRASAVGCPQDQLFIGFCLYHPPDVGLFTLDTADRFVVSLAIVDKWDRRIVELALFGSEEIPHQHDFSVDRYFGIHFGVSQFLRRECERDDGSIRGCVALEIFP